MRRLLCWLFGHEREAVGSRQRVCVRCHQRETMRRFGEVIAWEVVTGPPGRDLRP